MLASVKQQLMETVSYDESIKSCVNWFWIPPTVVTASFNNHDQLNQQLWQHKQWVLSFK